MGEICNIYHATHKRIHKTTADICNDVAKPDEDVELRHPEPYRRWLRLLVIAAVGALLVVGVLVIAARIPKLQAERKAVDSSKNETKKLLLKAAAEHTLINCPCQSQPDFSWCDITIFYIYVPAQDANLSSLLPKLSTFNFTKENGRTQLVYLCNSTDELQSSICQSIMTPVMNIKDSRTHLSTSSAFTRPELLYNEITTRIDTNMYEQSNSYTFLNFVNKSDYFNYSQGLSELVRRMALQFSKNSSSSTEDFWMASGETRRIYSMPYCFGMNVSWDMYLATCNPGFCDVEFEVSIANRVLRAIAQVGGITTVISLALRFLIWPSLTRALNYPTSKPVESSSITP